MLETRQPRVAYRAVLLAAGLLLLGLLFRELVTLLVAVLVTVIVAIPLAAAADRLERYRVPRPIGALAGLAVGLAVIGAVLALVIPPFVEQADEFVQDVPGTVEAIEKEVRDTTGSGEAGTDVQRFLEKYTEEPSRLIGPITSIGLSVAGVAGALALMLITAYYIAVRPEPLIDGALSLFPPDRRQEARRVMGRLRKSWIGWMQGVAIDMLVSGALLYIGLTIIGLEFAIFFAVFTALLVVVPYFGSIISGIPPVAFALADSPEKALLTLGVYVLVQQVEGNVIVPLVMSQRVKLHPALIAVGVVVVGQLFGIAGLFVAVPILSMMVILTEEVWVRPMERARGVKSAADLEVAPGGEAGPPPDVGVPEEGAAAVARAGNVSAPGDEERP